MPDTQLVLLAVAALALPLAILSLYPSRALRYLQRKRYQYEVTFSLYMMTPTEKFIFNSILFLFVAMVLIAAALYLPTNVSNLVRRAWYYLGGDDGAVSAAVSSFASSATTKASDATALAASSAWTAAGEEVVVQSVKAVPAAA